MSISVTSLRGSSAYNYAWLFDRDCGISFIYSKIDNGPNIDPWGNPQFMALISKNAMSNETKNALYVTQEWKCFIVLSEKSMHFILCNKILWSEVSKGFWRSIKIILVWNDLLLSLVEKCTTIHFFEDNLVFDCELIFLSPLILKAIEK